MQYKVFNYELWQDKSRGTYYTRFCGMPVEVSREVYYELMSHENADRYAERRDLALLQPLNEDSIWLALPDIADEIVERIRIEDMLSRFSDNDRIIIRHYLTREMSAREIEVEYGIPHSTVIWRGKKLMVELKGILEKLVTD